MGDSAPEHMHDDRDVTAVAMPRARLSRQPSLGLVLQPLFRVGDRVRVNSPEDGIALGAPGVVQDVLPWELGGANPILV